MRNNRTHAMLLALVGGYILYIAYQLFDGQRMGTGDMSRGAAVAFIALFTAAGIGILLYALSVYRAARKLEKEIEETPDEEE